MDTKQLELIHSVRKILEEPEIKKSCVAFHEFPFGACGEASIILALILQKEGIGAYQLILAEKYSDRYRTHSWIETKHQLIDITADQFDEKLPKVWIIDKRNKIGKKHLGFTKTSAIRLELAVKNGFPYFQNAYRKILDRLAQEKLTLK